MEKENQSIMSKNIHVLPEAILVLHFSSSLAHPEASTEADTKRIKLCYKDPSITVDSISKKWAELLSRPHPPDLSELRPALIEGIHTLIDIDSTKDMYTQCVNVHVSTLCLFLSFQE